MKILKQIMAGLASGIVIVGSINVQAQSNISAFPLINPEIMEDSVDDVSDVIINITDNIDIQPEKTESSYVYAQGPESYTQVYYSQPVYEDQPLTLTYDEFMSMYSNQLISEETESVPIPANTDSQQAAYDQALANYNMALAEYEAANQMIETTKDVEVEIVEEITDEEGNVSEVTRIEIQTVTEMIPAGDIVCAQANLDAAKAQLDTASQALAVVETENQAPSLIEEETAVQEEVTYASSGTCGDNAKWTLDDNGLLTISGTGKVDVDGSVPFEWGWYANRVVVQSGITGIGWRTFFGCRDITSVSLPEGLDCIGPGAFYECTNLKSINIPSTVKAIYGQAFKDCQSLTSISIPFGLKVLGDFAFQGCTSLSSVSLPTGIEFIGSQTFNNTPYISKYSGDFIVLNNYYLYQYNGNQSTVTIPQNVRVLSSELFKGNTTIKTVNLPGNLLMIGDSAFEGCTGLKSITIPKSVTFIGLSAFAGCTSLASVSLPDGITYISSSSFEETPFISGYSGEFIILKNDILYKYNGNKSTVTVPDNIRCMATGLFSGKDDIKSVIIPKGIFEISDYEFNYNNGLTSFVVPDTVETIRFNAFYSCSNLKYIVIPTSVNEIYPDAFDECSSLKDVYYQGTEKEWNSKKFTAFGPDVTIHFIGDIPFIDVPVGSWYYDVAKECYETGLINGTSQTTFSPMQTMTRAMVVTILWRMNGQPSVTYKNTFKDVSSNQWYAKAISWAVQAGVVHGYGDGTFKPDAAVTREQVAVMLANYAGYKKVYKPGTKKLNTYPDGSQVSTYAQAGMKWALTNGIISGDGAGYLRPMKSAARAEGAAMLLRMNNWLN